MVMTSSKKRFAAVLALALLFSMVFAMASPALSFATGNNQNSKDPIDDILQIDKNTGQVTIGNPDGKTFGTVVEKYRKAITFVTGICAVTMLLFTVINITKLGAAGDNEQARKKAIGGIITTGIATTLLASAAVIVGFFWNILG